MKESSSRGCIKGFPRILAKSHVEILKKYRVLNSKVWASDDEFIKTISRYTKRFFFWLSKT
jgi:hypothetical protein